MLVQQIKHCNSYCATFKCWCCNIWEKFKMIEHLPQSWWFWNNHVISTLRKDVEDLKKLSLRGDITEQMIFMWKDYLSSRFKENFNILNCTHNLDHFHWNDEISSETSHKNHSKSSIDRGYQNPDLLFIKKAHYMLEILSFIILKVILHYINT